jgi:hypothetical protein
MTVRPSRRSGVLLATFALTGACLSGCGSGESAADRERSTDTDVSFTGCNEVKCTGELDGAAYEIVMPDKWNGTLLLYSHGYRQPEPAPPSFDPVNTSPDPAPGWSSGNKQVGEELVKQGYAIAGSAYASNGWAVADGVKAGEQLHEFFVDEIGQPNRTIVWGDSLGGLVTDLLAERHSDWVSGAVPMCGVLAGPNRNLDLALDVAYAVKTFFYPELKLTGYASWDEAVANWQAAIAAITAAAGDVTNGVPKILLTASLVDAPSQVQDQDGSTVESQVRARAESIATALGYGTFGRYDIEQRVGGNPSDNSQTDYSTRISADERSLIETVSAGATDRLLAQLASGERLTADDAARKKFADTGTPTGDIGDPMLTVHTTADPLVLVQNETVYADEVRGSKDRTGDLVRSFILPPASYPSSPGAPYGAGHCNFTGQTRVGAVEVMNSWVQDGIYPGTDSLTEAFGTDSGYNPAYVPGPWPAGDVSGS